MDSTARQTIAASADNSSVVRLTLREAIFVRMLKNLQGGSLRIHLPSGAVRIVGDATYPLLEISIHNAAFFKKAFSSGSVGFGESYVDGDWDTPDLSALLTLLSGNQRSLGPLQRGISILARQMNKLYHRARRNTVEKSRENIQEHYDLSNDFYRLFLDRTMTYSSARFKSYYDTLEQAQLYKIDHMLDLAGVQSGDHILEIGSGWGALALRAAQRGCRVTTITLSQEQFAYAEKLFMDQGVDSLIDLQMLDYRLLEGQFDAVISCEMIEAVGKEYLPSYFEAIQRSLKPGAKAVIQAITIPDERYKAYANSCDWIQKHIFPGGHLPSVGAIQNCVDRAGSMKLLNFESFGKDYAETLSRWSKAFNRNWRKVEPLGFDEPFRRKWNYYFSYCEAGFDNELIDVQHVVLERYDHAAAVAV